MRRWFEIIRAARRSRGFLVLRMLFGKLSIGLDTTGGNILKAGRCEELESFDLVLEDVDDT